MKKVFCVIGAAITLYSCGGNNAPGQQTETANAGKDSVTPDKPQIIGRWTEPIPGMEKETQGFELLPDSSAKSINSATLLYTKWWLKPDTLTLVSKSIGNRTEGIDTTSYLIVAHTQDSLILKDKELILRYKKN
ncbi:lipocalin-like domain-containing protein [Pinibacter aurantiacus]|uniref:Lipocalin family protein n=1 Tax=Pinibacter aurantiacus TaxID=2851599 RepID=A0A9E2W8D3_9BACT|nr:lipocalin family protein [Pinibacter aurantiacus]MBV4357992.1 lipocalin family protein [Pinibacter aurantiacus]